MNPIPEWHDRAACQGENPDLFFPGPYANATPAKRICATCRVREDCLQFALDHNMQHGIWGGTTLKERRRIHALRHEGAA